MYLHYPEYHLLVDSSFTAVDVMALGKQDGVDPGVIHGLVRPQDAHKYQQDGVVAEGTHLRRIHCFQTLLTFPNPMRDGKEEMILVEVIILGRSEVKFDKGGHPSALDIQHSGTCIGTAIDSRVEATILLGMPKNKVKGASYYLLLARLHKMTFEASADEANALYDRLQLKLGKGGFEARRFGGSGGKVEVNKNMLDFIHVPGNFPRKGKGVKFIPNGNKWTCIYISPYDSKRKVMTVEYSQPQKGGSMSLNRKDAVKFPCLRNLAESKPFAALLLQALNCDYLDGFDTGRLCYTPPLQKEFRHVSFVSATGPHTWNDFMDELVLLNKHTLVGYPVGYHLDVFADGEPALENRICFVNTGRGTKWGPALGRGGAGPGKFCWALLDWPQKKQK